MGQAPHSHPSRSALRDAGEGAPRAGAGAAFVALGWTAPSTDAGWASPTVLVGAGGSWQEGTERSQ